MKPILISPVQSIGINSLLFIFIIICTGIWSAEEMYSIINMIAMIGKIDSYPKYTEYFFIVFTSWIVALIFYALIKWYQNKKLNLIKFSINLAVDNSYHFVQVPAGLSSSYFLKLFFKFLKNGSKKEKYNKVLNHYFPLLEIRRNDSVIRLKDNQTLLAGGLRDGDICQIVGKPKNTQ